MSEEPRRRTASESLRDSSSDAKETAGRETLRLYEFGPFRLDPTERKLLRGNEIVALTPKAFDTLQLLVRNSGRVLEKDELISMLWPDTFVEEGSLSNHIFLLRKALGEDPGFIETVPRRGYRFVGAVRQFPVAAPAHLEKPPEVALLLLLPFRRKRDGPGPVGPRVGSLRLSWWPHWQPRAGFTNPRRAAKPLTRWRSCPS